MKRWLRLAAVLSVAVATPLVAQQASTPAPQGAAAQTSSARSTAAGPRLQPEFRRAQPAFADSTASASAVVADTHTIRMTTVVLVLVVVILVLLIAN
jgi:hypothetical protein